MSQVHNLITDHLDTWTLAIETKSSAGRGSSNKFTLLGIKKLRELILEMAVRGLLVPQDPNDEPASVLLDKIAAEKAKLIKDGKIKKTKAFPEISENEKPFNLPTGWAWSRLNDAFDVRDGTHDSPKPQESGFPLVTSKNLSSGRLDLSNVKYISEEDHLKIQARSKANTDDILFAMIGSIGNPVVIDTEREFSIKNVALFKYYDKTLSTPSYLKQFLDYASFEMKERSGGGVQPFVSLTFLRSFLIPIPPIEEQNKIVTKVDELMALCDQLEQQTLNSIEAHQTLVETLLNELVNPNNTANTQQAWSLIAENFDVLFTTEKSIDTLKQTILQLAVMGKLVPQNPNDEPASELLQKIAAEKAQLIKDKKIKKTKPLPEITEEEKPYDLPNGWEWIRLIDAGYNLGQKTPESEFSYIDVGSINKELGVIDEPTILSADEAPSRARKIVAEGTVIYSTVRPYLLNIAIVDKQFSPEPIASTAFAVVYPFKGLQSSYIYRYLRSNTFIDYVESCQTGIAYPAINDKQFFSGVIPIPPIEEQKRIVTIVNELMTICDQLKTQLQTAQQTQTQLAQSIAQETLK